jgi:hypothetical protein
MPRMKILNALEQEAFESPPVFNSVQRKQHFDFPLALRHLAASLPTPTPSAMLFTELGLLQSDQEVLCP